jgi:cytochrome c556
MDRICSQCHENKREKRDFDGVHAKHVADKKRDCASCHEFSRPERGLSLTKKD